MSLAAWLRPLVFAVFLLLASGARAATCPVMEGSTGLVGQDARQRLDFIREALRDDAPRVGNWRLRWSLMFSVAIADQLAIAPFVGRETRTQVLVSAGSTAVGLATVLITPFEGHRDAQLLDEQLRDPARLETAQLCATLAEAEGFLAASAQDERFEHGVISHLANVLFNLGVGALLGFGFHTWSGAASAVPLGIAVGELMIFTAPTHAEQALERYKAGALDAPVASLHFTGTSLVLNF